VIAVRIGKAFAGDDFGEEPLCAAMRGLETMRPWPART